MIRRLSFLFSIGTLLILGGAGGIGVAQAASAPAWSLTATPLPSNFAPGATVEYLVVATNVGTEKTSGTLTLQADFPAGLSPIAVAGSTNDATIATKPTCEISSQNVICTSDEALHPGRLVVGEIELQVSPAAPATLTPLIKVEGGGVLQSVTDSVAIPIGTTPVPFGVLPGFRMPLSREDGTAATQAGSHPAQLTTVLDFPTEKAGSEVVSSGHPRDVIADLPRGLIGNPTATPVLCTEAELTTENEPGCPNASQVGTVDLTTFIGPGAPGIATSNLYNMVPPPGAPAEFGFNAAGVGLYVHLIAGVRSDGDFGIYTASNDILALGGHPVLGLTVQLWGDPSSPAYDHSRGSCGETGNPDTTTCKAPAQETAFFTLPGHCTGQPDLSIARADSWEEPGIFREATYHSADLTGSPVSVSGCNALDFKPTISVTPTTNLTDSPAGLDVALHQPQESPHPDPLTGNATATLRDAVVTLPAGLAVNPSQANGLAACSAAQIGLTTELGATPIHFSKQPDTCPAAAKLGTVEVTTPLLAQYDSGNRIQIDPQTGSPIPEPLHGSVYLAKPFDNPFGSLLAIYLSIDDARTGTIAKLAGRVETDPLTGQLTNRFVENPELPLEDIRLHLFSGARASLITPPTCGVIDAQGNEGPHTTTTDLTPWSAPETPAAHPASYFQLSAAPGGGGCPRTAAEAPVAPSFSAGTLSPQAGAYSPFVLRLSRKDGSQRISSVQTTLPAGLTGKLAGVSQCSEAQIVSAQARSKPGEGTLEQAAPSCPAASALGSVNVAVGAGPTPFYTTGQVYLAGPYRGAPLSLAIITPALAGPFDLGTVAVRAALHIDPETAQIHAVSDAVPQILDGIPLDIRSIALHIDRPDFTLNPTSCDEKQITGTATSVLNLAAPLTQRFQAGGCDQLAFKPKLGLKLLGATRRTTNPRLIANLTYPKAGAYANIARAQVKLPKAAFLDNSHIGSICTRVQFAADICPSGSIYGKATATTPILDYPISGPVYLRSSSHQLPDLVVKLKGPESQPIEVDLVGRTDSVKGALRNTFEAVPDVPASSFHLELFGGKRGLVELSRNLCAHDFRATVRLSAQNGNVSDAEPKLGTSCAKGKKHHGR